MSLRLDADARTRRDELKAEIRRLEKPAREVQQRERKAARKERSTIQRGEGQRRERQHDKGYLQALRKLPCCIGWGCSGPVEAAHIRYSNPAVGRVSVGMQRKPDDRFRAHINASCAWEAMLAAAPFPRSNPDDR